MDGDKAMAACKVIVATAAAATLAACAVTAAPLAVAPDAEFARGCWIARMSPGIVETLRLLPDADAPNFYTGTQLRYEQDLTVIVATWRLARDGSEIWRLDRDIAPRYDTAPSDSPAQPGALRFEYDRSHDLVVRGDGENLRISPELNPTAPPGALNLQNLTMFDGRRDGCD
jgi:hypothetical protein